MQRVDILDANDPRLEDYRDLTDVALRRRIEPAGGCISQNPRRSLPARWVRVIGRVRS